MIQKKAQLAQQHLSAQFCLEHKNDWLYIFFPTSTQLFLVKINGPIGTIEIIPGYETIDSKKSDFKR